MQLTIVHLTDGESTMTFQLLSADFDDASLGVHSTRTDDGQVLSVLFEHLEVESQAEDDDAAPQVRRAECSVKAPVRCLWRCAAT